jgi:hypothetical protein
MLHSSPAFADGITIPFDFGLPQFFILLVGLFGLALLVWAIHDITRGKRDKEKGIRIRRFHYKRTISGVVLLFISISLIWLAVLLSTYFGLTSRILIARVHATQIANAGSLPQMSVDLTLFDKHGNRASEQTYLICGDLWRLEGDIVKFADWTAILGLHTGYKLTRLEGEYQNPDQERTAKHCLQELNGGDDGFYQTLQNQGGWLKPVVEVSFGEGIILPPDGNTYNIYITQTGLLPGAPNATFLPPSQGTLALPVLAAAMPEPGT